MLSFLRDPNLETLPAEQQNENDTPQQEQEFLTVASHGKDVRRSSTILGVFFIIGLIALGLMIKKSSPKAASANQKVDAEQMQLEASIAAITGIELEMFEGMDEILKKFYEFSNVMQIDTKELVKNPFLLENFLLNLKSDDENNSIKIDPEVIWRETVKQKAKDMKLYSIMQSEKGICCMIDNKILYVGDTINDFTVKEINRENVKLDLKGIEISLSMSK